VSTGLKPELLVIASGISEAQSRTFSLHPATRTVCLPGHTRVIPGTLGAETPALVVTEAE